MLEIIDLKAYHEEEAQRLNSTDEKEGIEEIKKWGDELAYESYAYKVMSKVMIIAITIISLMIINACTERPKTPYIYYPDYSKG